MEKKTKSVHLFNCDKLFDLDSVESLFTSEVTSKLSFNISIQKHYFNISQMSEMSESTILSLQIDFAVFVVHAHESRLSINEDNAGIGYAKIYRALQQATDDNVIIVIGGDDNYKDDEEENRVVLSRWSKRKISSQFNEEYLDGRKSFVFSWNKQHRKIHEEALLHYFDPDKKGEKFEPKLDKVEFVDEVEIPSNNEQNPVAAGFADKDSAAATAGPEETRPRPQEEGKEDPKGQTGSTGDPNIMEPSRNEQVPSTEVVTRGNSWWSSLRKYCTIL